MIQTQGDANNAPDPWTAKLEGATAWQLTAVVPKLGYVVNALRSPALRMAAIFIAPLLLALLFLLEIWGVRGRHSGQPQTESAPSTAKSRERREVGLPFVIGPPLLSHPEGES